MPKANLQIHVREQVELALEQEGSKGKWYRQAASSGPVHGP